MASTKSVVNVLKLFFIVLVSPLIVVTLASNGTQVHNRRDSIPCDCPGFGGDSGGSRCWIADGPVRTSLYAFSLLCLACQ